MKLKRSIKTFFDNKGVVLHSTSNRSSTECRIVSTEFLIVKKLVQEVSIELIGTHTMLVDSLTKALIPKDFHGHVISLVSPVQMLENSGSFHVTLCCLVHYYLECYYHNIKF